MLNIILKVAHNWFTSSNSDKPFSNKNTS